MIIIDNNPISFSMNKNNGLPIITWYENLDDIELIKLIPLLEYFSKVHDVRPIINQIINKEKNEIDFTIVKKLLLNYGYTNDDKNDNNNMINYFINDTPYNDENINFNNGLNNNSNYLYNGKDKIFNNSYRNNNRFYSLSNMSYDEIQNEGYIEENSNNMNILIIIINALLKIKIEIIYFGRQKKYLIYLITILKKNYFHMIIILIR